MEPQYDIRPAYKQGFEAVFYQLHNNTFQPSPYRCNVCFFIKKYFAEKFPNSLIKNYEDAKLRRCQDCLYISYCSSTHQKLHWKLHKPFCRQMKHYNFLGHSKEYGNCVIEVNHIQTNSKYDMYTTYFFLHCYHCHANLQRVNINEQTICKNCEVAGYCSEECQSNHSKEHEEDCKYMKIVVNFYFQHNPIYISIKNLPKKMNLLKIKNLSEYLSYFGVEETIDDDFYPTNQTEFNKMIAIGTHSHVATLLYCLQYCKLSNKNELTIQSVKEYLGRSRFQLVLISSVLPKLKKLTFVNVSIGDEDQEEIFDINENNFELRKRLIYIKEYTIKGKSKNVFKKDNIKNLKHPDLVFMDNMEFDLYPQKVLNFPNYKNSIFVWTLHNLDDSNEALKILKTNYKVEMILENFKNPFKDLNPEFKLEGRKTSLWFLNWYVNIFKFSGDN